MPDGQQGTEMRLGADGSPDDGAESCEKALKVGRDLLQKILPLLALLTLSHVGPDGRPESRPVHMLELVEPDLESAIADFVGWDGEWRPIISRLFNHLTTDALQYADACSAVRLIKTHILSQTSTLNAVVEVHQFLNRVRKLAKQPTDDFSPLEVRVRPCFSVGRVHTCM